MRSQGHVHFIRVSARTQMVAAGGVAALATVWLGSVGTVAISSLTTSAQQADLLNREAKVARAEDRVANYRQNIDEVASDLKRRQGFIEKMVDSYIDLPDDTKPGETVSNSDAEAKRTIDKVSVAVPEAGALARIEAEQLAFVEKLTRYADRRSAEASATLRQLGLNPKAMIAGSAGNSGEGGPLIRLATASDGSVDPRFQRLGASLARMDALENGLASIPQVSPTNTTRVSSTFGYRHDPFNGTSAFHAGIDFPAPLGTPIYAAAKGVVTYAGPSRGYGNLVEITHGNGLVTRYGHLSRFTVHKGQAVAAGAPIAAMGSTGRSTGSHLHFEVRVNGKPVNPRPFLEASATLHQDDHVHQES